MGISNKQAQRIHHAVTFVVNIWPIPRNDCIKKKILILSKQVELFDVLKVNRVRKYIKYSVHVPCTHKRLVSLIS